MAFYVFRLMEAFDWKFLPSQLLAEDELLMDDLFAINQMSKWTKETVGTGSPEYTQRSPEDMMLNG